MISIDTTMKKIIFLLALCMCGYAGEMHAQKFLKGLKDKAGAVVKDAEKTLKKPTGDIKSNTQNKPAAANDDTADDAIVKGLHKGTIGDDCPSKAPEVTASTAKVIVTEDTPYLSSFFDGIAYIYDGKKAFYIDKHGKRLFDTDVIETNEGKMPRFSGGVVMEVLDGSGQNSARIRDRQGNIVKELPNVIAASHFVDGTALVIERPASPFKPIEVKYVNARGEYVFSNLNFTSGSDYNHTLKFNAPSLIRKQSEGLTAFVKQATPDTPPLWGFRDASGNVVIEPTYALAADFSDGLAAVLTESDGELRWGFIDKTGRMVIAPKFTERPSDFDSGYSMVLDRRGDGYYMDHNGEFVLGPINKYGEDKDGAYFYISPFQNGYAIIGVKVKDPKANWDYFHNVYFTIDSSFNRLAWTDHLSMHLDMERNEFVYYEGNYYLRHELDYWLRFDPKTFDRIGQPEREIYSDDLLLYISSNSSVPTGYVDKKGNFAIILEESRF